MLLQRSLHDYQGQIILGVDGGLLCCSSYRATILASLPLRSASPLEQSASPRTEYTTKSQLVSCSPPYFSRHSTSLLALEHTMLAPVTPTTLEKTR